MTSKIQLTILLVSLAFVLQAQNRFLRRGEKAYNKKHYPEAIANLKNIEEKNSEINRKIAESYYFLGDYQEAEAYYQKIHDSEKSVDDLLALSHIYLNVGNHEAAILFSERAAEKGADGESIDERIKAIQELNINSRNSDLYLRSIASQPKSKSLGVTVTGNKIVFSNLGKKNAKGDKTYQLFYSELQNQKLSGVNDFAPKLDDGVDVGAVSFSGDGKSMYYTRWYTKRGRQYMEIVEAEFRNEKWRANAVLPFNDRKYSCAYPFLTQDGKSIYFASDMPGGFGGMDLYISKKRGNSWGTPVNLGPEINTKHNEIYPRLLKDGNLWFASNGQVGYGMLDLFYASKTKEGNWGNIKNAGADINSSFNDFSIHDSPDTGQVLFVSDRNNKGIRDRIYSLGADRKVQVELLVKDMKTQKAIENPKLEVKKVLNNQNVKLNQLAADAYEFDVSYYELGKGILYEIQAEKQGYETEYLKYYPVESNLSVELLLKRLEKSTENDFVKDLTPIHYPDKRLIFRKIHFDSGVQYLNTEAKQILKKLADFWKIYPDLGVVINAHSDSRGSAASNKVLSLKRAKMAVEYLVAQGIEQSKISYNAYGEQFIINGCIDGVDCSEEQHRENRRLELLFVVE
jgi:outer membrane protein OmpA-like peptidoglycan-associated protein